MNNKFPKIELPFPYRPKKRKKIVVGYTLDNSIENSGESMVESKKDDDKFIYKYSCAMLNLSDDPSTIIGYWCDKYIDKKDLYINEHQGMDGLESDYHVTIKYGLHDSDPKKLKKLVSGFGAVELKFGKVSKFSDNPDFDVLKISVESKKLHKLNEIICDNMNHTDTFPDYIPHTTLAYVKKGTCEDLVDNDFFTDLTDKIDEMCFTTRDGETYFLDL